MPRKRESLAGAKNGEERESSSTGKINLQLTPCRNLWKISDSNSHKLTMRTRSNGESYEFKIRRGNTVAGFIIQHKENKISLLKRTV
jgi:hypothetical protein